MSFSDQTLSDHEKTKIRKFIDEGLNIFQQLEDLKAGLGDLAKVLGEELGVKPGILMKAIRTAHKSTMEDVKEQAEAVEEILIAAGRI